jgi:hypothetical protein
MKAAVASVASLVAMLLVILLGVGSDSGWVWIAVLFLGALSAAFALVAVGGALRGKDESDRALLPLVIALPVLFVFAGTIVAIVIAIGNAWD